jgi:hypothetical protein
VRFTAVAVHCFPRRVVTLSAFRRPAIALSVILSGPNTSNASRTRSASFTAFARFAATPLAEYSAMLSTPLPGQPRTVPRALAAARAALVRSPTALPSRWAITARMPTVVHRHSECQPLRTNVAPVARHRLGAVIDRAMPMPMRRVQKASAIGLTKASHDELSVSQKWRERLK